MRLENGSWKRRRKNFYWSESDGWKGQIFSRFWSGIRLWKTVAKQIAGSSERRSEDALFMFISRWSWGHWRRSGILF